MIKNNKQKINFHNKKNKKNGRSDYTQYAVFQGGGATHLRAEPADTHARWTPSTAQEPPMEAVKFLYIFRRFI